MLWFLIACQTQSQSSQTKESAPQKQNTRVSPKPKIKAKPHTPPTSSGDGDLTKPATAPPPLPTEQGVDSTLKKVLHPPPPEENKRQTLDVCVPYYRLLELEALRGTKEAPEKERLSSLRELNRLLDYHPAGTAQALVELEKELFVGKIELSIEKRKEYWYSIHSYIGGICRVDLSHIR